MSLNRTGQQNDGHRQFGNVFERYSLIEQFQKRPALNAVIVIDPDANDAAALAAFVIANRDFEVLGTNMTTALCTFSTGGGITLTSAGGSSDQAIVAPHLDATQSSWAGTNWATDDEVSTYTRLVTGASIASTIIWSGLKLTNTSVTATDDDQAFFRYEAGVNGGRWQAVWSIAGTDVSYDTGVTAVLSTVYDLQIIQKPSRVAQFYINGKLEATSTALTTAIDLIPYTGVQGVSKAIAVRGTAISKTQND